MNQTDFCVKCDEMLNSEEFMDLNWAIFDGNVVRKLNSWHRRHSK